MDINELKQIRVTIKDGDALGKLPWQNIKRYLQNNGWIKIYDIQFGSQWQHPNSVEFRGASEGDINDPDIITLPETRDIVDYKHRMHDILQILEMAADMSQLELYEILMEGDF
jgi:hypothetical protein